MTVKSYLYFLLLLVLLACIDPINYDVGLPQDLPIAVYGRISNQPGPYQVYINRSVDVQSKEYPRIPVSVKQINLIDDLGENEVLVKLAEGVYQTDPGGIQGRIGGVYKIRIELFDGRIYESIPDTLLAPGQIDSLYSIFSSKQNEQGIQMLGFDILVNSIGNKESSKNYMWVFNGTFKASTRPELMDPKKSQCFPFVVNNAQRCNYLPPCTGLLNTSVPFQEPLFERIGPCECCTCWYQIFNSAPILSDDLFTKEQTYNELKIYRLPLNEWLFMYKVHTEVSQFTLSDNSFRFYKSIKEQKEAIGSLFQPVTGKIPINFKQISGAPGPINGIFYAAGVHSKRLYVTRDDVPNQSLIPEVNFDAKIGRISCLELFPNATNVKPNFWID